MINRDLIVAILGVACVTLAVVGNFTPIKSASMVFINETESDNVDVTLWTLINTGKKGENSSSFRYNLNQFVRMDDTLKAVREPDYLVVQTASILGTVSAAFAVVNCFVVKNPIAEIIFFVVSAGLLSIVVSIDTIDVGDNVTYVERGSAFGIHKLYLFKQMVYTLCAYV